MGDVPGLGGGRPGRGVLDQREVIIEGDGHHRRTADDTPVDIGCVWFITRRAGQMTHFRDYMNPLTLSTHQL